MKKNLHILLLSLSTMLLNFAYADKVPAFMGGLHEKPLMLCYQKVLLVCKASQLSVENFKCFEEQMSEQAHCEQGLAFLTAANGTIEKIEHYRYMDIVYANVIAADHSDDFFMISHAGDFVSLLGMPDLDIKKAAEYKKMIKRFPELMLWPISDASVDFPKHLQLKSGGDRIIFQQEMTNQCLACERAGFAQVAYDFNTKGDFIGATLLRLLPPPSQKEV